MNQNVWLCTVLGLLLGGCPAGCAVNKEQRDNAIALAEAGSKMAENHGATAKVKFDSDGGGFDFNQQYRFTLGRLQAEFETNPLAPILHKQMESQQAVLLALVASQANLIGDMQLTLSKQAEENRIIVQKFLEQQPGDSGASVPEGPPPNPG